STSISPETDCLSFSFDAKLEMIGVTNKPCCAFAQCCGFLIFGRSFGRDSISLMTDRKEIASAYADAIVNICGVRPVTTCSEAKRYTVSVPDADDRLRVMRTFGYEGGELSVRLNFANIRDECCRAAFIRGAFLACGSVTDPKKEYHLELSVGSMNLTNDFIKLFDAYDGSDPELDFTLIPNRSQRSGMNVIYFNDSTSVEDFLSLTGAQNAAMQVMNAKMYKAHRNNVNRRFNFETANIDRSSRASEPQIRAIEKIISKKALDELPPDLRRLTELRADEPALSLRELGELMDPPLSRTAVNYRLKKIVQFAQTLK
ncbi:MAG: DNA-binding protein WhiA, partial [Clostridia bacterium]|nr:DNA-binding protein WhiA [Clostridia bacterium]